MYWSILFDICSVIVPLKELNSLERIWAEGRNFPYDGLWELNFTRFRPILSHLSDCSSQFLHLRERWATSSQHWIWVNDLIFKISNNSNIRFWSIFLQIFAKYDMVIFTKIFIKIAQFWQDMHSFLAHKIYFIIPF